MNRLRLHVRRNEPVRPAWDRLVKWASSLKHITYHPEVSFRFTPYGTIVRVKRRDRWAHPWQVGASAGFASVSTGTVNGVVPSIKERGQLRRIDNRDKSGKLLTDNAIPRLELSMSKASKEGTFFISLKVKTSASAKGFVIVTDPKTKELSSDDLEIVQTDSASGPKDGFSYYPLAMVYLTEDRKGVAETFQIAYHNLRFTFQERNATEDELKANPDEKKIGRGIFYPV